MCNIEHITLEEISAQEYATHAYKPVG